MDNNLFKRVKAASQFQNAEDIKVFEEGVWKLAESQEEETFKNLIELFDDKTPYPEVMFNLVHALESYPDEKYIILVLDAFTSKNYVCKEWYARLIIRILNEDKCKSSFKNKFNLLATSFQDKITNMVKKYYPEKIDSFLRLEK
jgi:hypothetical protein